MSHGDSYFNSYDDLKVHQLMLSDHRRLEAYRRAIEGNRELFYGKIVLDVGSGTGILSIFCAKAGAKKVYAVEAAKNIAAISRRIIEENGFSNCIEVIRGKVEEITLPTKVDVLVSEWMGFYLLHECMLDSVMVAKEKFLTSNGLIFPKKCFIYAAICELPTYFSKWDNVHGVHMTTFGKEIRQSLSSNIDVVSVPDKDLVSSPVEVMCLDLHNINEDELKEFTKQCFTVVRKTCCVQGVCLWFDVIFPGEDSMLSTSPKYPPTHWKQTVIIFPEGISCTMNDAFVFDLTLSKESGRAYGITVEVLDPSSVVHPIPCLCNNLICVIQKRYLESLIDPEEYDLNAVE